MTTYQQERRGYQLTYKNRLIIPRVQGDNRTSPIPVKVIEARARIKAIKKAKRTPHCKKTY